MRKLYLITIGVLLLSGCSGWTYNGIRGEDLRHPSGGLVAGAVSSFVVHTAGHIAWCSIEGKKWHFDGLSEMVDGNLTDSEAAWMGRAGFVAQLGVGWGMKLAGVENDFTQGYNAATMFEVVSYPMWAGIRGPGDDLEMIGRGGNEQLEWGIYSALAVRLNLKGGQGP